MKSLAEQEGKTERVFLVGAELKQANTFDVNESMEELAELATTAGATIIGEGTQKLDRRMSPPSSAKARPANLPSWPNRARWTR